jgi:hypothetical protein
VEAGLRNHLEAVQAGRPLLATGSIGAGLA